GLLRAFVHGATGGGHRPASACPTLGSSARNRGLGRTVGATSAVSGVGGSGYLPEPVYAKTRARGGCTRPCSGERPARYPGPQIPGGPELSPSARASSRGWKKGSYDGVPSGCLGALQGTRSVDRELAVGPVEPIRYDLPYCRRRR